jgi:hypothetical protein
MAWQSSPEASVSAMQWGHVGKALFRLVVCIVSVLAITALEYDLCVVGGASILLQWIVEDW